MKKGPVRINEIRKHLKALDDLLHGDDTWEEQTPAEDLREFIKQSQSLLTDCIEEIKTCKQHEEQLFANTQRLETINTILQFKTRDLQAFLDHALDQAIQLTESEIGYIYFYDETNQQFTLNSWSKEVMAQCSVQDPQTVYQLEKTGAWGEAVRQRQPIVINQFDQAHPIKKGYPEGHAPLKKFMTVPIISEGEIIAVVGVANKKADYGARDVAELTLLMEMVWRIVEQRRAEQHYLQLFNQMLHGVAVHEMVYDEAHTPIDYRFLRINPGFEKITGLKASEVVGRTVLEVLPNTETFWIEIYGKVLESGEAVHFINYSRELGKHYEVSAFKTRPDQFATIVTDATDRLITENKLRESEEKYRLLVERQKDLIVKVDAQGRFLYVSPSYCQLFGKSEAQLLGETFTPQIHEDDLALTLEAMEALKQPPHTCTLEQRALTEKGWRWLAWSDTALVNTDGEIEEIIGLGIDITENKQMEQALAENERKFRIALKNSPVVVFEQDRQLRYTWMYNPDPNFNPEPIIGKSDEDLLSPTEAAKLTKLKQGVLDNGKGTRTIIPITTNGKTDYNDLTIEPVIDDRGNVTGITCSCVDITDLKMAEQALQHSYDLLDYIIEHNNNGVAVHDRDLNYIYVSQHYLNQYGIKDDDVIGKHHYEVFPDLPQKWQEVHQRVLQGEVLRAEEDRYERADGSSEWTRWECRPWYEGDGNIGGIVVYTEMITNRVQREEELRQLKDQLQVQVEEKTKELKQRVSELERFYEATIEREFRMKELRDTITELKAQLAANQRKTRS
jgi:PAS domain S-box-containing protein